MKDQEKELIVEHINKLFNVDVTNENRKRTHADARKMLSYYLRNVKHLTFQSIADMIFQTHGTILYNCEYHKELYQTDKEYKQKYDTFIQSL